MGVPAPTVRLDLRRGSITRFVTSHAIAWETAMAALTAVYVILSFFEDAATFTLNLFTGLLFTQSALFFAEFSARFWDSPQRLVYLRGHWIDLVTAFPLVGPLRALRLLRLLRFMRLGRSLRTLTLGRGHDTGLIWPCLLLFWIGSAYALWLAEHSVNPAITDFKSALTYAFLTACTVGYGSFTPMTIEGKIVAGLIVFVAIGLIGFTSARLTSYWLGQRDDLLPRQLTEIERDIAAMKELLAALVKDTGASVLATQADPGDGRRLQ
jgi:voltage-gated potassium channel